MYTSLLLSPNQRIPPYISVSTNETNYMEISTLTQNESLYNLIIKFQNPSQFSKHPIVDQIVNRFSIQKSVGEENGPIQSPGIEYKTFLPLPFIKLLFHLSLNSPFLFLLVERTETNK